MGGTTWSKEAYESVAADNATKSKEDIFSKKADDSMSAKGVTLRESRDSDAHPTSLAVMIGLDVTGSMLKIPEKLVKGKLGAVMDTLLDHGVEHPQILFCAIGDHECDKHPFQIGQYESGNVELMDWLSKVYLEGGGGGNYGESYALAWYFAGRFTSLDCFEKRGQKGFIFTIGDEPVLGKYPKGALETIFGGQHSDMQVEDILAEAQRMYHVFHIYVNHHGASTGRYSSEPWKSLLGQNVITIDDPDLVAEVIASTVAMINGAELSTVVSSFDPTTATSVTTALAHIKTDVARPSTGAISL